MVVPHPVLPNNNIKQYVQVSERQLSYTVRGTDQRVLSTLVVMSGDKCRTQFSSLWKYRFLIFRISGETGIHIWSHPPCTACAIVLFRVLSQTLLSFKSSAATGRNHDLQAVPLLPSEPEVKLRSARVTISSSLGICCESAVVPCMPSRISWFWHPHSHVVVARLARTYIH